MKKFSLGVLAALLSFSLWAQSAPIGVSINVAPAGYMNHTIITTFDSNALAGNLSGIFDDVFGGTGTLQIGDQVTKDIYNAYALGLDISYSYFYLGLSLGLPVRLYSTGFDPIAVMYSDAFEKSQKIGGTTILDGQIGGTYTFMKDKPLSFDVGGGLAVNYIHVKRPIASDSSLIEAFELKGYDIKTMTEYRNIIQLGLGLRAGLTYKFMSNVGINLSVSDSFHFLRLYSDRKFKGETSTGLQYTYTLTTPEAEKENIKHQFANNFAVRLAVALSF